jgi:YD repeat-containing protein
MCGRRLSSIRVKENSGLGDQAMDVNPYVFISYADEDRFVAERVVRALTSLGWRVWWDREIAPGKTFDERIGDRIRSAAAVVVLWSQHSVASEWVREEASDAKRRDILIPALVEHVEPPFGFKLRQAVDLTSWNGTESAPEFSPLAAALRALLPPVVQPTPTVATRTHEQGDGHKSVRHLSAASLMLALLVAAGAASGLWFWDAFYRRHVQHFATIQTRYGLPEGVGPLSEAQFARRNASLEFIRHGRRNPVDEVRLVNSSGNTPPVTAYVAISPLSDLNPLSSFDIQNPLASDMMTLTRVTFARDGQGRILEQNWFTAAGRLVYSLRFANRETAEYKMHGFTRSMRASGIAYLRYSFVESGPNAGLIEKVVFLDAHQQPQPSESGAFGVRRTFDERGLTRESFPLGPKLEDRPNSGGLFRRVLSHSPYGDIIEEAGFDERGARVADASGVAITRSQYDPAGNLRQVTFSDRNDEPVAMSFIGAARMEFEYDDGGRPTKLTFFGVDQRPVLSSQGIARKTFNWLTPTHVVNRFYDPALAQKPVLGLAFEVLHTFDERGLLIEESFRDHRGEPTRIDNGCSTIQQTYDAAGNAAEYRCLNEERRPTVSTDGWSTLRSTFDDRGNPITTEWLGPNGKPGKASDFYTARRREYHPFGKLSKESFLDASGRLLKSRDGYASVTFAYDQNGNRIEEKYFDEANRPVMVVAGFAMTRSQFDGRSREIRTSYFSADERPARTDEGYATIRYEYDSRSFVTSTSFFDEADHWLNARDGYATVRRKWNGNGKLVETTYFDASDRPVISKRPGSGRRLWTYDTLGRIIERSDYDTTGKPMANAYGYSTIRYSYDQYGHETGRQLLDASGRPLTLKVIVDKVTQGSVAADAGFRAGDVIRTYDGERVETSYQFSRRFELFKGDRRREITIERGGQMIGLDVRLGRIAGFELQESADR